MTSWEGLLGVCCPACLGVLADDGPVVTCGSCRRDYRVSCGVPELIDWASVNDEPEVVLATWHLTQLASLGLYEAGDPSSCADADRRDVQAVRSFLGNETHALLDIGSGAFARPGYVPDGVEHYVGLDPIIPDADPGFALCNAFAEQLPFQDATFDCVLFATSLDHVLHVPSALREAKRVLADSGKIVFWGGVTERGSYRELTNVAMTRPGDAAAITESNATVREALFARLPGFESRAAEFESLLLDEFHIRHFSLGEVIECFSAVGMLPTRFEPIIIERQLGSVLVEFEVVDRLDVGVRALTRSFETEQKLVQGLADSESARLQLLDSFQTALQGDRNANAEHRTEAANAIAGLSETTRRDVEHLQAELASMHAKVARLEARLGASETSVANRAGRWVRRWSRRGSEHR